MYTDYMQVTNLKFPGFYTAAPDTVYAAAFDKRIIADGAILPCRIVDTSRGVLPLVSKQRIAIKPNQEVLSMPLYCEAKEAYEDTFLKKLCCDFGVERFESVKGVLTVILKGDSKPISLEWLNRISIRIAEVKKNMIEDLMFSLGNLKVFIVTSVIQPNYYEDISLVRYLSNGCISIMQPSGATHNYYSNGTCFYKCK